MGELRIPPSDRATLGPNVPYKGSLSSFFHNGYIKPTDRSKIPWWLPLYFTQASSGIGHSERVSPSTGLNLVSRVLLHHSWPFRGYRKISRDSYRLLMENDDQVQYGSSVRGVDQTKDGKAPYFNEAEVAAAEQAYQLKKRRIKWLYIIIGSIAAFALILTRKHTYVVGASPVSPGKSRPPVQTIQGPVIDSNFADPCMIKVNDKYHAFATNKYKNPTPDNINIQYATSPNFKSWTLQPTDALPDVGDWARMGFIWAPDVVQLNDSSFVMYYSARTKNITRMHCIGAASSKTIAGPYKPLPTPIACPVSQGGAIDPEGFQDVDGKQYVLYKVDGNNLINRTSGPFPTPIMLQEVSAKDGITLIGDPVKLLDRGPQDGPLIEAPTLARVDHGDRNGPIYFLFYSSNVFTTKFYDVSYATSLNGIKGPYVKTLVPLLVTGDHDGQLFGPGGLDVGPDGKAVFHSAKNQNALVRTMWTGQLTFKGTQVSI
ncbi:hypothetical protein MMC25_003029 [Agyrium rufum]|nr:hypothetical protein [Agyrium rufum]